MLKRILTLGAVAVLGVAGPAFAEAIDLQDGPVWFKFTDYEQVQPCTGPEPEDCANSITYTNLNGGEGQGNWGVVVIDSIYNGVVTNEDLNDFDIDQGDFGPYFTNGGLGENMIFGIFYGIDLTSNTTAEGGFFDLYWADVSAISLSQVASGPPTMSFEDIIDAFTGVGSTGVELLARLQFMPGVNADSGDCDTTIESNAPVSDLSGGAFSYLDVIESEGGAWADALNGNWFQTTCGNRDIRLNTNYNEHDDWDGDPGVFGLSSDDPGRAMVVSEVPEPATLTMLGIGLVGAAIAIRRRKTN